MSDTITGVVPEQTQEGTPRAAQNESKLSAAAKKAAEDAVEAAHKDKLRELELKAKELELLERQANLEDITERLAERQMKREQVRQKAYSNGATLRDTAIQEASVQKRCNHRKGGDGAAGVKLGQGVSPHYAVIKHTMLTGELWVRCQRCGKTWKPPIKADYAPGGLFDSETKLDKDGNYGIEGYVMALTQYENAKNFPTNNTPSSSQQFKWSDNGAYAREVMRYTTLR